MKIALEFQMNRAGFNPHTTFLNRMQIKRQYLNKFVAF